MAIFPGVQRKLTTILAADAEDYSRVMVADEIGGIGALRSARKVFSRLIAQHGGRIANTAGDGLIAEFPSVVEAVQCAISVQRELAERNGAETNGLRFRVGIHLGDVIVECDDLLGEGVNLAARLQANAEPGGILISRQVHDQIQHKIPVVFEHLGSQHLKNFSRSVDVYRAELGWAQPDADFASVPGPETMTTSESRPDQAGHNQPEPERRRGRKGKADGLVTPDLSQRVLRQAKPSQAKPSQAEPSSWVCCGAFCLRSI